MATTTSRAVLLRWSHALLVLLRSLVTTPTAEPAEPIVAEPGRARPAPADRARVLRTQFTAGVRGSRAPPATAA